MADKQSEIVDMFKAGGKRVGAKARVKIRVDRTGKILSCNIYGDTKHHFNPSALIGLNVVVTNRPDIEQISETVDSVIRSNNKLARQIKLHCCHKYNGKKLKEIGACFGIGESGVSQTSRRISEKLKTGKRLKRKLNLIGNNLKL